MKAICDVHISWRIVRFLQSQGVEAVHVNELPDRWYTADKVITELADKQEALVITKDADFRNSFILRRTPKKLLHICLGNASNQQIIDQLTQSLLVLKHLATREFVYLELNSAGLEVLTVE